ncbi:MAG: HAMP domain-containing protein [Bosea sp.]|uniref:histidine kinase n=2 Tax=Bosea TaxID=85413 RepID=A0A927EDM0_9HYPH|nr:ATP-binding protein [Bosea spartocytisi]MBD3847351.1 HAMP domain-containing protein [Bosea spartocytisi]MCP4737176.1 HAMP domain-containing protein [Bosea sp. (in: a-proteobacteria)]MCT4475399.1 ATP-binding protein [Bosea spartocytisi]
MHLRKIIRSTGFRFAVLHTLVFVVCVGLIGWLAEVTVTTALMGQARQRVDAEVAALAMEFEHEGSTGLLSSVQRRFATRESRLRYAILDRDNRTVVGDHGLAAYAGGADASTETETRQFKRDASDSILVAARSLADGTRLVIADDLESIEDVQDVILDAFLLALGVALALGFGTGALLTYALLKRVDAVTRTADAIIGGDLSQRIELTGSGDEFDRLSATLNTMLDRIGGLMENVRQVSNDIAHDLRTPLARLRQGLEVARGRARTGAEYQAAVDRALDEADGLLQTFSALLRIAHIESGARRSAFRTVDLSEVMQTVAEAYGPAAEDGNRVIRAEIADTVRVHGDRELLTQLFSNLVENALQHTPQGALITMHLTRQFSEAVAEVADNGPGIPEQERSKAFRRFYRLERSRITPGNGLGLSMVAAIADVHHATVQVLDNAPGLRVAVRFASGDS